MSCKTLLFVLILTLISFSCGGSRKKSFIPPQVPMKLADYIKNLPTKTSLDQLGTESAKALSFSNAAKAVSSIATKFFASSVINSSQVENSNISYEMKKVYSLIAVNDLCRQVLGVNLSSLAQDQVLFLGDITYDGVLYRNINIKYLTEDEKVYIDIKFEIDEHTARFVAIEVDDFNTESEVIHLSYFDKQLSLPEATRYQLVEMSNLVYAVSDHKMLLYKIYVNHDSGEMKRYSNAFMYYSENDIYYFYCSQNDIYENYTYEGVFYPVFVWETERNFSFIALSDGYAGKTFWDKYNGRVFHFYGPDLNLVHFYCPSDTMSLYMWPLKKIQSAIPGCSTICSDQPLRLWIDSNNNGSYDSTEPRLETNMEQYSQVCLGNGGLEKEIPIFASYVSTGIPCELVKFNPYNNPIFANFIFTGQDFLSSNRAAIKTKLDAGVLDNARYLLSQYPTSKNPRNIEW